MRNLITEILRSLGVRYALMIPTNDWSNDWSMRFIYNGYVTEIKVTKSLLTKVSYISLYKYDDGKIISFSRVALADITAEKVSEVIKDFINRKEVN